MTNLSLAQIFVNTDSNVVHIPLVLLFFALSGNVAAQERPINFNDHIKPILRMHCLKCHSDARSEGDVNMQSYASFLRGGGGGKIVVPGRASQSLMFQAITNEDPDARMPPNSPPLSKQKLAVIQKWIESGLRETAIGKALTEKRSLEFQPTADAGMKPKIPAMPLKLPAIKVPTVKRPFPILSMAASPCAPLLAVAAQDHVRLLHIDTEKELGRLAFPEGEPHVIRFSHDGSVLLVAGGRPVESGRVVLFDVGTGKRLAEIGDELDTVIAAALSPNQRLVALGGSGRIVKVYSTADGSLKYKLTKHTEWITSVSFSPDGSKLATADRAGGIHLWDAKKGGIVLNLADHKAAVRAIDWRADSKLLVSVGEDGKIIWWDTTDGFPAIVKNNAHPPPRPPGTFGILPNGILSASFSPTGFLVTTGRDATMKIWGSNGNLVKSYPLKQRATSGNSTQRMFQLPISAALSHDGSAAVSGDSIGNFRFFKDVKFGEKSK